MARSTKLFLAAVICYGAYMRGRGRLLALAEKKGARIGPRWLGVVTAWLLRSWSRIVGVKLATEGGDGLRQLNAAKKYMIIWHPHGFIAWAAMFIVNRMAVIGHPHGREWFALVAPALFNIPILAEALMLVNARRVAKQTVDGLLSQGASIAIQPGGAREQLVTRHDQEQLVLPAGLGFIRMAIKYGVDLLPVYIFGENQTYTRWPGFERTSEWLFKQTGLSQPAVFAKLGLPVPAGIPFFGMFPRATDLHVRWGAPVEVGPAEEEPSDARVESLLALYLTRMRELFDRHAQECLPAEVAARGLQIKRLDGKAVPANVVAPPEENATLAKL